MKKKHSDIIMGYSYILPSFILICVFAIIPIFMNIYYSFTQYNILTPPQWIGLDNYKRMLTDPYITASLKNTMIFTLLTVPGQTIISLVIAAVLAAKFRTKLGEAIRSALFIPVIASSVLVGTIFSLFLAPTGLFNSFLNTLHLDSINWLGNGKTAMFSVCMATIWKNVGYFLVIIYAGILDIPTSHYEAAEVDGATAIQKFFYITIPSLRNIIYLVITLGTIWSFQVFDMVYTMTNGGPGMSTVTLVLTIYNSAFKGFSMGYAAAIALLMFVLVLFIQRLEAKLFGKEEN
jgi:multiple sugar transport system permease protein